MEEQRLNLPGLQVTLALAQLALVTCCKSCSHESLALRQLVWRQSIVASDHDAPSLGADSLLHCHTCFA